MRRIIKSTTLTPMFTLVLRFYSRPSARSRPPPVPLSLWTARYGQDGKSTIADPLIDDVRGGNYTVRDGSPALARGFVQIQWQSAGPRR